VDRFSESDMPTLQPRLRGAPPPVAMESLVTLDLADGLTVLVNDPQRHTDSVRVLSALLGRVDPAKVRILVATGTHSFPPAQQRRHEEYLSRGLGPVDIRWHDCRSESLVPIGRGSGAWRGHPWLLGNRPLLAIGSVEPHYFAGYTGAHKTLTIGCASFADIEADHAHALDPASRPCALDGNPVFAGHRRMVQSLQRERGGSIAAVNVVQVGGSIVAAGGGGPTEALDNVRAAAAATFVHHVRHPADALVLELSGPLAQSFYQADKAIKNNEWAVRNDGAIVLKAPCPDGVGQDHFMDLLRRGASLQACLDIMADRGYRLGDHKAVRLRALTDPDSRAVRVFAVSDGLSPADADVLGLTKAPSVSEALGMAGIAVGKDRVYRLLDAGNLCVLVNED